MKYPKEYLDEIKFRLKVSQVVGKSVQLKKRRKEFIALSPFKNKKSKAWEVFNGVEKSWPDQLTKLDNAIESEPVDNSMFWGFVGNNLEMVKKLEARNHNYWFADTPYFGRFDNNNLKSDNHYWRICKNKIHAGYIKDCKPDRFEKFGLKIKAPDFKGSYILVCPSSDSINN